MRRLRDWWNSPATRDDIIVSCVATTVVLISLLALLL